MMPRYIHLIYTVFLLSVLSFWACEDEPIDGENLLTAEDSLNAIIKVNSANDALESVLATLFQMEEPDSVEDMTNTLDFSTPYDLYNEALTLNPDNLDANFGVALTGLMQVTQDQSFQDMLEKWEDYFSNNTPFKVETDGARLLGKGGFGLPVTLDGMQIPISPFIAAPLSMSRMTIDYVPQFSELQDIIRNVFLPYVDLGIAGLSKVEADPTFSFMITSAMQPDDEADPLELDLTEVYAIDMMLHSIKAICNTIIAYNFDFVSHDAAGIETELNRGSDFATLNNTGVQDLSIAYSAINIAIDKLEDGLAFLEAETDNQDDDIISQPNQDESEEIHAGLDKARDMLTTPTWMVFDCRGNYNSETGWVEECDSTRIDIQQFFSNPIEDFKEMVPPYTVVSDTLHEWHWTSRIDYDGNYPYESVPFDITVDSTGWYQFEYRHEVDPNGNEEIYEWTEGVDVPSAVIDSVEQKFAELTSQYGINTYNIEVYVYWGRYLLSGTSSNEAMIRWEVSEVEIGSSWVYPIISWDANTFEEWKSGWPDPTFHGIFPDWTVDDLLAFLEVDEYNWKKVSDN